MGTWACRQQPGDGVAVHRMDEGLLTSDLEGAGRHGHRVVEAVREGGLLREACHVQGKREDAGCVGCRTCGTDPRKDRDTSSTMALFPALLSARAAAGLTEVGRHGDVGVGRQQPATRDWAGRAAGQHAAQRVAQGCVLDDIRVDCDVALQNM